LLEDGNVAQAEKTPGKEAIWPTDFSESENAENFYDGRRL
jgi:hypothetical protein